MVMTGPREDGDKTVIHVGILESVRKKGGG